MRWSLILLTGCEGLGVIHGNGVEGEERRSLDHFVAVQNEMNVNVVVIEGDKTGAVVSCDENLLGRIQTEVHGTELRIQTPVGVGIRPTLPCTVEVTVPSLDSMTASGSGRIDADGAWADLRELDASGSGEVVVTGTLQNLADVRVSGSGNVVADGLVSDEIVARLSGSGTLTLSGTVGFADLDVSGSGDIAGRELTAQDADIRVSGSGNVELTATGAVDVDISGSGDVTLWGGPSVQSDTSGSGEVHIEE